MVRKIVIFGLIASVLIGILVASQQTAKPLKVSGYIEADEIRLGSRVGGRVHAVHIEEGDTVRPGELLLELDPFDLLALRAEADAQLQAKTAEYHKLKAGFREEEIAEVEAKFRQLSADLEKLKNGPRPQEIDVAKAEFESAHADFELQKKKHERIVSLFEKGVATKDELDQADKGLEAAQALINARQKQLDLLLAGTRPEEIAAAKAGMEQAQAAWKLRKKGNRQEDIDQAHASMRAAQSALDAMDRQIAELKVYAPLAGTIQAVDLHPGDLVKANSPVLSMLDNRHLWVRAYVPENHLNLSLHQKLKVTVDSYPEESFTGEITFISEQAEFTPRNVQTPEERSKQVFRIKVHLVDGLDKVRAGMGADVWLEP